MDRFALLFDRNRLFLAGCIVAYTGLCLYGASRLTFHHDPEKLFTSEKLREMVPDGDFASSEHAVVIVVEGEDLLTRDAVEVIRRIVQEASQVDGIASVFSMLSVRDRQRAMLPLFPPSEATAERFEQARRRAISHPLLIGQLLSEDRKTALVIAELAKAYYVQVKKAAEEKAGRRDSRRCQRSQQGSLWTVRGKQFLGQALWSKPRQAMQSLVR